MGRYQYSTWAGWCVSTKTQESSRTQKPLHPSINYDFTPFHEPKNRRPNISLTKIIVNQQKVGQKAGDERRCRWPAPAPAPAPIGTTYIYLGTQGLRILAVI